MKSSIARHGLPRLPLAMGFITGIAAYEAYNVHKENKRLIQVIEAYDREFEAQGKVPLHRGEEVKTLATTMKIIWKYGTKSD